MQALFYFYKIMQNFNFLVKQFSDQINMRLTPTISDNLNFDVLGSAWSGNEQNVQGISPVVYNSYVSKEKKLILYIYIYHMRMPILYENDKNTYQPLD